MRFLTIWGQKKSADDVSTGPVKYEKMLQQTNFRVTVINKNSKFIVIKI